MFFMLFLSISLNIQLFTFGKIYKDLCENKDFPEQCKAIDDSYYAVPKNMGCDPLTKKDCNMYDFVSDDIASCALELPLDAPDYFYARCRPHVKEIPVFNIRYYRIVAASSGHPSCVPVKQKKMVCGEKGTRCVCDTGENNKIRHDVFQDIEESHVCRCQWFIDYCKIPGICSNAATSCERSAKSGVVCKDGSVNHCLANPTLCADIHGYCVELDEEHADWIVNADKVGNGYACINKKIYNNMAVVSPYCNFDKTDHVVTPGKNGFRRPANRLDYCCYQQLVCVNRKQPMGGYMFKKKPCYCSLESKKCFQRFENDAKFGSYANEMINVVDHIKDCTMDDSGLCDPLNPVQCNKGDLIDPSIAHCKINCKSGPLLPIELRACRIRKCLPPNNHVEVRIIDVPNHLESSRCATVKGLPVECGMKQTRCVCDGKPTFPYFTDGCRCQFWPG